MDETSRCVIFIVDLRYYTLEPELFTYMKSNLCFVIKPLLLRICSSKDVKIGLITIKERSEVEIHTDDPQRLKQIFIKINDIQVNDGCPLNQTHDVTVFDNLIENSLELVQKEASPGCKVVIISSLLWPVDSHQRIKNLINTSSHQNVSFTHVVQTCSKPGQRLQLLRNFIQIIQSPSFSKGLLSVLSSSLSELLSTRNQFPIINLSLGDQTSSLGISIPMTYTNVVEPSVKEVSVCSCHQIPLIGQGVINPLMCRCSGKRLTVDQTGIGLSVGTEVFFIKQQLQSHPLNSINWTASSRIKLLNVPQGVVYGTSHIMSPTSSSEGSSSDLFNIVSTLLSNNGEGLIVKSYYDLSTQMKCLIEKTYIIIGEESGRTMCCSEVASLEMLSSLSAINDTNITSDQRVRDMLIQTTEKVLMATPITETVSFDCSRSIVSLINNSGGGRGDDGSSLPCRPISLFSQKSSLHTTSSTPMPIPKRVRVLEPVSMSVRQNTLKSTTLATPTADRVKSVRMKKFTAVARPDSKSVGRFK